MTELAKKQPLTTKEYFQRDDIQEKFAEILGEKSTNYITSVLQAVGNTPALKKADPKSVFNAAAMAAVLDLPINSNLGMAYIIPYNQSVKTADGWEKILVAQFQIGYQGFIQLAIRTGHYKTINAAPVHKQQLKVYNPLEGHVFDWNAPQEGEPIGYASFFKLKNGFSKVIYMTVEEITAHGKKYSKNFDKQSSTWNKNFPGMALKTVIKQLLEKWGPKSLEMQRAIDSDQSIIQDFENNEFSYPDNPNDPAAENEAINADFEELKDDDQLVDDDQSKDMV